MTAEWKDVTTALLGSWPSQVASWGREALAAYLGELQARGVTPASALIAIRSCPAEQKFPPSAPELAALARQDPSKPTFSEALGLMRHALRAWNRPLTGDYANEAEMLKVRYGLVEQRSQDMHPLVASFVQRYGVTRLQDDVAALTDEKYGGVRHRDLERAWDRHCEAFENREVAAIASGNGRAGLGRFDPYGALGIKPKPALESGDAA